LSTGLVSPVRSGQSGAEVLFFFFFLFKRIVFLLFLLFYYGEEELKNSNKTQMKWTFQTINDFHASLLKRYLLAIINCLIILQSLTLFLLTFFPLRTGAINRLSRRSTFYWLYTVQRDDDDQWTNFFYPIHFMTHFLFDGKWNELFYYQQHNQPNQRK
jgi:hypothetical protein